MAGQSGQGSALPRLPASGKTSLFVSGFIFLKIGPHTARLLPEELLFIMNRQVGYTYFEGIAPIY